MKIRFYFPTIIFLLSLFFINQNYSKVIWDKQRNQWYHTKTEMYYNNKTKKWYYPATKNKALYRTANFPRYLSGVIKGFNKIHKKYKVKIYIRNFSPSNYSKRHSRFNFLSNKDNARLLAYGEILIKTFNKYPADFVIKTKLREIAIVKNLYITGQPRYAMPDPYSETLYLSLDIINTKNIVYAEHVIHHEYYHLIEEQFNKSMYYTKNF